MGVTKRLVELVSSLQDGGYNALLAEVRKLKSPLINDHLNLLKAARQGEEMVEKVKLSASYTKRMAQHRSELYSIVCDRILRMQQNPSESAKLRYDLEVGLMLWHLGLIEQALGWVRSARSCANAACDHVLLVECLDIERRILKEMTGTHRQQEDNRSEIRAALQTLTAVAELRLMADEMLHISRHTISDAAGQQRVKDIIAHPLVQDTDGATSFKALIYRHNILSLYYRWSGDMQSALQHAELHLSLWGLHPEMIQYESAAYISAVGNLMNYSLQLGYFDRFEQLKAKLERNPRRSRSFRAELFRASEMALMLYRLNNDLLDEVMGDRTRLLIAMDELGINLPGSFIAAVNWNMAIVCMISAEGRMALQHFARIDQKRVADARPDLQAAAKAFSGLMLLDRQLLTDEDLRRLRRTFANNQIPNGIHKVILDHLPTLAEHQGTKNFAALANRFLCECRALPTPALPGIEEYTLWLLGHITGRPLRELYQNKEHIKALKGE